MRVQEEVKCDLKQFNLLFETAPCEPTAQYDCQKAHWKSGGLRECMIPWSSHKSGDMQSIRCSDGGHILKIHNK